MSERLTQIEKKIEVLANVAIVLVAFSIVGVLLYKCSPNKPQTPELKIGGQFSLPGANWSNHKQTLVLLLQKSCHFCVESAPFYQKLSTASRAQTQTRMLAVLPNPVDEAKNYLKELGIEIADIRQADLGALGVAGTPTIVLVNDQGTIIESWVGKLKPEEEEKILQKVS